MKSQDGETDAGAEAEGRPVSRVSPPLPIPGRLGRWEIARYDVRAWGPPRGIPVRRLRQGWGLDRKEELERARLGRPSLGQDPGRPVLLSAREAERLQGNRGFPDQLEIVPASNRGPGNGPDIVRGGGTYDFGSWNLGSNPAFSTLSIRLVTRRRSALCVDINTGGLIRGPGFIGLNPFDFQRKPVPR